MSEQRKGKKQTPAQYEANCNRTISEETKEKQRKANKGHSRHTPEQIKAIKKHNTEKKISDNTRKLWSKQRLGKNEKIKWPADEELFKLVLSSNITEVAKLFNTSYSNVKKRLRRRGFNF